MSELWVTAEINHNLSDLTLISLRRDKSPVFPVKPNLRKLVAQSTNVESFCRLSNAIGVPSMRGRNYRGVSSYNEYKGLRKASGRRFLRDDNMYFSYLFTKTYGTVDSRREEQKDTEIQEQSFAKDISEIQHDEIPEDQGREEVRLRDSDVQSQMLKPNYSNDPSIFDQQNLESEHNDEENREGVEEIEDNQNIEAAEDSIHNEEPEVIQEDEEEVNILNSSESQN